MSVSACAPPFLSSDEPSAASAPNDPADLVQGLEELAVQPSVAADPLDVEVDTDVVHEPEDLQQVTLDDVNEDFFVTMREVRLAHPVLGIFNDTDMLRIAQGTCGTLRHQGSYGRVLDVIDEQVERGNLSVLAATGAVDWVYESSEVFCPATIEGLSL